MSLSVDQEFVRLEVEGDVVRAVVYAGGTTGLLLLASDGSAARFWLELAEGAESEGLSALALTDQGRASPTAAALAGLRLLKQSGVADVVLVAAGSHACDALQLAATGAFAALAVVDPVVPAQDAELLLGGVRVPKLALFASLSEGAHDGATILREHAVGRMVIRYLPTTTGASGILGEQEHDLATESILTFATRSCGDGRADIA